MEEVRRRPYHRSSTVRSRLPGGGTPTSLSPTKCIGTGPRRLGPRASGKDRRITCWPCPRSCANWWNLWERRSPAEVDAGGRLSQRFHPFAQLLGQGQQVIRRSFPEARGPKRRGPVPMYLVGDNDVGVPPAGRLYRTVDERWYGLRRTYSTHQRSYP